MIVAAVGVDTVCKEAATAEERARLEREGQILAFASHPGVVELLAAEPGVLILRRIDGGSLGDAAVRSEQEVAALGAAIATVLADLHDIGVVHGRVAASHVLLDRDGRPVLCGLGDGRCPGLPEGPSPADDVAALGTMLTPLLASATSGAWASALARAGHARPARRPTARQLSRTLAHLAAGAPPTGPIRHRPTKQDTIDGARRTTRSALDGARRFLSVRHGELAVAVAVAMAVLGLTLTPGRARPPVVVSGGVVVTATGRYRVGRPGDQIVLGRWRCVAGADALPAVLRPSTGEVWDFDGWAAAPGGTLDPRLVARVPGAAALRVEPAAPGCDRLVVVRRAGPPISLVTGPP